MSKKAGLSICRAEDFDLLEKIAATIKKFSLFNENDRVLVGFSGGMDSLCLLHCLHNLTEYNLVICALYINHSLRPVENEQEIQLLNFIGRTWGIETRQEIINLPEQLQRKKQSLQLLARAERYRIFEQVRSEIKADKIALAHHLDDQAETILYRIIRGTGLDGLTGIPIMRDGVIVRPFLEVTRAQIRQYAHDHNLVWVEDSSNQKLIYWRNKIRHQLIPQIEQSFNPGFKNSLQRLAGLAVEQRDFMEQLVDSQINQKLILKPDRVGFGLKTFLEFHPYLQYYFLKKVLSQLTVNDQLESLHILRLRSKIVRENYSFNSMHIYKKVMVYQDNGNIYFKRPAGQLIVPQEPVKLQIPGATLVPKSNCQITVTPVVGQLPDWTKVSTNEVFVDAAKLQPPLYVRFWKPGDRFWPLGSTGTQKLQDFFVDHKVNKEDRGKIPLILTADQRVVWVVGFRLDDRFKVTRETSNIWRLTLVKTPVED